MSQGPDLHRRRRSLSQTLCKSLPLGLRRSKSLNERADSGGQPGLPLDRQLVRQGPPPHHDRRARFHESLLPSVSVETTTGPHSCHCFRLCTDESRIAPQARPVDAILLGTATFSANRTLGGIGRYPLHP